MDERLDLTVAVNADTWAYAQRRLAFLEAMLVRVLRDHFDVQEWFAAAELEALRLPGLPPAAAPSPARPGWKAGRAGGRRGDTCFTSRPFLPGPLTPC